MRADCVLLRSLKGQEPAPSGCWELPLELHGADRGHSLHPDRVRDPAPLRVTQPHRPAQSHGKQDPSRELGRRWGGENEGFCSGDAAVAGKPQAFGALLPFFSWPWLGVPTCLYPSTAHAGCSSSGEAGCSVCLDAALGNLDPAPQAWLCVFDRTKYFVLSLPCSARNPAPLLALPTSPPPRWVPRHSRCRAGGVPTPSPVPTRAVRGLGACQVVAQQCWRSSSARPLPA